MKCIIVSDNLNFIRMFFFLFFLKETLILNSLSAKYNVLSSTVVARVRESSRPWFVLPFFAAFGEDTDHGLYDSQSYSEPYLFLIQQIRFLPSESSKK